VGSNEVGSSRESLRKDRSQTQNGKVLYGKASYYAEKFHGRKTANGETFDMNALTAAHRSLPFGTICRVTNLSNQKTVNVKINDRGPFIEGRIIDLSKGAARSLDALQSGVIEVKIEILHMPDE
jgi:rare lipoprotein A